ncbi:DUF1709-domain-containing protein [Xylariaceae sp. FL0804]|nr:DUF1709-domain-containing protein [Xylariaceae sp. FL0804]
MASEQPVTQPLRISKSTPTPSPSKSGIPRPLSEIPATEKRRNSPSWTQPSKKMTINTSSSPFQSSPVDGGTASPRLFWQNRNTNGGSQGENDLYGGLSGSPSPTRRSSIERLQKASRVKNSTMFAREQKNEYDPTRVPTFERPLSKVQGNAYGGRGAAGLRMHARSESQTSIPLYSPTRPAAHARSESTNDISLYSPTRTGLHSLPQTPSKELPSPIKSSLSAWRFKSSFDSQSGDPFSDYSLEEKDLPQGKALHRHPKSVTFDAAPPQVNEYEMATPDMSSIGTDSREGSYDTEEDEDDIYGPYPGEGAEGQDDSFDATLEDTDKTPVFGPDDWPQDRDSRYDSSPMPESAPAQAAAARPHPHRSDSATSSGEHRPLPPLPGMDHARTNSASSNGLSATTERMLGSPRNLPSPPPASVSKSEIQNIGHGNMSLEERLKLMMLSDEVSPKSSDKSAKTFAAEQQRERRMRRAGARDRVASPTPEHEEESDAEANEEGDTLGDISGLDMDYQLPSISRQSILRRVNGKAGSVLGSDDNFGSPAPDSMRATPFDPDVPIASIEESVLEDISERNEVDDVDNTKSDNEKADVYDLYQRSEDDAESQKDGLDDDSDSHYSDGKDEQTQPEEDSTLTPRAASPAQESITNFSATLPQVNSPTRSSEFTRSLQTYMLPQPKQVAAVIHTESRKSEEAEVAPNRPVTPNHPVSKPEYDGSGWGDPEDESEPGTPESVIHHPVSDDEDDGELEEDEYDDEPAQAEEPIESPAIPEQVATIKASGSKLKTRPSATPSDIMAMREARRHVSREAAPVIPPIPDRHRNRLSQAMDTEPGRDSTGDDFLERHPSFKERSLTLDLDLGLSLDQDFERVIEAQKVHIPESPLLKKHAATSDSSTRRVSISLQSGVPIVAGSSKPLQEAFDANITTRKQRGYVMRQNTKVVTASDKDRVEGTPARTASRSAGNSPVKQQRPQSWTVEPWNGKHRRSIKGRRPVSQYGPVPPMPGQESNAAAISTIAEDANPELATEECGERGRLFVKVMGVKDLDLPLPRNERTWFSLTLDNGVHCVTTAWLELARNAPIGQEFELVVPNDLEFQLTLNVKLERPEPTRLLTSASTKVSKPKTSTFSRVFASPKKRREMEARQRAEEEEHTRRQQELANKQKKLAPTSWDLLSPLAADDGSFARSYVCLKEHESRCYGRPYMVEIPAFNEWAIEEASFASSVKSKRAEVPSNSIVRRAPYKVGKLEVQLLFVPRPKGSSEDDMPKSMNSSIRELKAAEERMSRNWEGHLSQQGGDCPYWRRRYFKLVGTKLTAYHEATRQPRATINLSNAKRLIDDRRQLTNPETTGRGGRRRRSAFAEEEEGYMFVEEGFRIRFNNGEVIDFYADTPEDKDGWMRVLGDVIGREGEDEDGGSGSGGGGGGGNGRRKWCDLVLKKEEALRKRAAHAAANNSNSNNGDPRRVHSRTKSMLVC